MYKIKFIISFSLIIFLFVFNCGKDNPVETKQEKQLVTLSKKAPPKTRFMGEIKFDNNTGGDVEFTIEAISQYNICGPLNYDTGDHEYTKLKKFTKSEDKNRLKKHTYMMNSSYDASDVNHISWNKYEPAYYNIGYSEYNLKFEQSGKVPFDFKIDYFDDAYYTVSGTYINPDIHFL